jgi:hypothetical protein
MDPVAVHESGHASASFVLGADRGCGPISIVPTDSYRGVACLGWTDKPREADIGKVGLPYPLLPARLRRHFEVRVMSLLAGSVAESLHVVRETVPAQREHFPFMIGGKDIIPLPPRQVERLEEAAATGARDRSDISQVHKILAAMHGDDTTAEMHAALLENETRRLLREPRARRMVVALADELLQAGTLAASQWRAILGAIR